MGTAKQHSERRIEASFWALHKIGVPPETCSFFLSVANTANALAKRGYDLPSLEKLFSDSCKLTGHPELSVMRIPPVRVRRSIPLKTRYQVFERDRCRCRRCGRCSDDDVKLHVDHLVAVANGGSDEMSNLQVLCEECNLGKGTQ